MKRIECVKASLFIAAVGCAGEISEPRDAQHESAEGDRMGSNSASQNELQPDLSLSDNGFIRLVNLDRDSEAIDFCVRASGGAFVGPLMQHGTPITPGEVRENGVRFGEISRYQELEPGALEVLVVPGDAEQCPSAADDSSVGSVELVAGRGATVMLTRQGVRALQDRFHIGEPSAAIRFVHAGADGPAVDFRLGTGEISEPFFSAVEPGTLGSVRGDSLGYLRTGRAEHAVWSVGPTGTLEDLLHFRDSLRTSKRTYVLIGEPGSSEYPLSMLSCSDQLDLDRRFGGHECDELGEDVAGVPMAKIRWGQFTRDIDGGIDVCLRRAGQPWTEGGGLQANSGAAGNIRSGHITRYVDVPAGRYDLKAVDAPADCTSAGRWERSAVELSAGSYSTGIIHGISSSLDGAIFRDRIDFERDQASVRFIHVAPAQPTMLGGLRYASSFSPVVSDIHYGGIGAGTGDDAALGYARIDPLFLSELTVRAQSDPDVDVAVRSSMVINEGETWTAFIMMGRKFNSTEEQVKIMACFDNAVPNGWRTGCRDARGGVPSD